MSKIFSFLFIVPNDSTLSIPSPVNSFNAHSFIRSLVHPPRGNDFFVRGDWLLRMIVFAFAEIMPKTNGRLSRANLPSFRSCLFNHLLHAYIYTLAKYKTAHSSAKLHKISDIHKYILYISVKKVIFAEYSTKYTLSVNFYTFAWLKLKDRLIYTSEEDTSCVDFRSLRY